MLKLLLLLGRKVLEIKHGALFLWCFWEYLMENYITLSEASKR